MKRALHTTGLLASLTLLLASAPAVAGPARPGVVPEPPGTTTFSHQQLEDAAGDEAGELVVITGDFATNQESNRLWATTRSATGTWGAQVEVASAPAGQTVEYGALALASDGSGVLTWIVDQRPGHYSRGQAWTRMRHADGTWTTPVRLDKSGRSTYPSVPYARPGGVAAVFFNEGNYDTKVARTDGSTWRTTQYAGSVDVPGTVALDDQGGLHALSQEIPRGGGGSLSVIRLAPDSRHWSRPQRLKTPYLSTDSSTIAVDARGRESVLVGYVGDNGYRPPGDTEIVGSTAHLVLAQRRAGGRFKIVWRAPATGDALLSQGNGQTRISWVQLRGHVGRQPAHLVLRSGILGSRDPADFAKLAKTGRDRFWLNADGGSVGAVSWLAARANQLWAVGAGTAAGAPVLLDDQADETGWNDLAMPADVAVAGTQAYAVWEHRWVRDTDADLVDSDVSIAPIPTA